MTVQEFAKNRPGLFWSTRDYASLSPEAVVEAVLNYGNWEDVQKLFEILTLKKTAEIFYRQTTRLRTNYDPKISHYFNLYFKKYA